MPRLTIPLLLLVALLASCTPTPEEAMRYNLQLIRFFDTDTSTIPASEAAENYSNRLSMHRRNSNFQEDVKPRDYMDAYDALYDAWTEARRIFPEDVDLATFLKSPVADRTADLDRFDPEQRKQAEALRRIDARWTDLVKVAARYKVHAPAEWWHK